VSSPDSDTVTSNIRLEGTGAAPGVAIGPSLLIQHQDHSILERNITEEEVPRELKRLEAALSQTRLQLTEIQAKVAESVGAESASIFDAHLLVVDDRTFIDEVIRGVSAKKKNVDFVLQEVSQQYTRALEDLEDEYLRERAVDIRDVTRRIALNLTGKVADALQHLEKPCILVVSDLTPSDTALLDTSKVLALVVDQGSYTSHTAILSRALEIPAVVSMHDATIRISTDDTLIVDGNRGVVIVSPTPEELDEYSAVSQARQKIRADLELLRDLPAEMLDGYRVMLSANLELPEELPHISTYGARGIGLFRTEFLFLSQSEPPDEKSQFTVYENIAATLYPEPVIIRTLDLGGDKIAKNLKLPQEINPFLGCRAIRFCLAEPELFKVQLRALVRASIHDNVHIMLPFISDVDEVRRSIELIEEAKAEVKMEGLEIAEDIPVGAMIEIPSAALTADIIAPWVDFFSIGTNDLVQYTLAVDRNNERIAHLYNPTHPSVLKLIRTTIDVAHDHGIWAGICGEMAGDPMLAPLLIGMGADEISVNPSAVPMVKQVIRRLRYSQAESLAETVSRMDSSERILAQCRALMEEIAPELLELR